MESQVYDLQEEIKELKEKIKEYENKCVPDYIHKNISKLETKLIYLEDNYIDLYNLFRKYLKNEKDFNQVMLREIEQHEYIRITK